MSLNGDTIIMRNGRSTSQVSIYNYPEHLNPFYEDDQHKRLRFWHINKNKDDGRRNSFSIGGLKDMWAFKSLRNKKKSSTLGINKTSESPPPLRRDIGNGFYTYDPRTRHSGDTNAISNNNFQRNIPYRSSLQDMNSLQKNDNGLGFIRNDQCRSTTQSVGTAYKTMPSSTRYVYGGSLSPQPLRSAGSAKGNLSVPQSHGSQTSVNTNPFDIKDIEVSEANSTDEIIDSSLAKKNLRKKRRAPAPPCITAATTAKEPRNLVLTTESSQQSPSALTELHIEEDVNISNLTAEIESFVKASNDIAEEESNNIRSATQNEVEPPVHTETLPSPSPTTKHASLALNSTGTVSKVTKSPSSPTPHTIKTTVAIKQVKTEMIQPKAKRESEEGRIECIHIHVDSPRTTPDINESSKLTSFQPQNKHDDEIITSQTSFVLSSPPSSFRNPNKEKGTLSAKSVINPKSPPVPMRRSAALNELKIGKETVPVHKGFEIAPPVVDNPSVKLEIKTNEPEMHAPIRQAHLNEALKTERQGQPENELPENTKQVMATKYTNKEDSSSYVSAPSAVSPEPLKIVETVDSPLEINFKNNLYRNEPRSRLEWKKSTLAPLETHVPPEKRKSVKDIIESINRSQRLLHAAALKNQPQTPTSDNELVSANGFSSLYQTKNIELNNFDTRRNTLGPNSNNVKLASDKSESRACPPKYEEVECEVIAASGNVTLTSDDDTEADPLKLNNSVIFEKFRVNKDMRQLRESSPTASNLDWNPLPKPKRTKNLTDI